MVTKRTPIRRATKTQFTPAALAAFKEMLKLKTKCSCEPINWEKHWERGRRCAACDQWCEQHSILHHELKLPPWEFPAVENPDAESPYPEGHINRTLPPDLEAQQRYRALEAACDET